VTLSQRLFLRILPTLIITIVLVGLFAYRSADREIENIYDAELINDANTLWVLLHRPLAKNNDRPVIQIPDLDFNMDDQLSLNEDADDYADAHAFRAWKGGHIVMVSSNSFPESVPEFKRGFSNYKLNGEAWRVYALPVPDSGVTIEVAEKMALRDGLVANIILNLSFPLMILVPAIAALVWFVINNGLSHIQGLVRQIRSRTPDDLSPIPTVDLPRDLIPLVGSLNQFMEKLRISLTLERRFADLAAHQLRTPQAGIKLLLQLIERSDSEDERQALMKDLTASNDRAMHLIEQMLNLARVSHQPLSLDQTNLFDLVAKVLADFGRVFNDRHLQVALSGDEEAVVATDSTLLRMMIDNIIDNAIKYSPDGGMIEVAIVRHDAGWSVSVNDSGPGIPVEHRDMVFQQFYRLPTTEREGTGLGLAIAAAIASRLSVEIGLGVPEWGYGLRMDLIVPERRKI